MKSNIKNYAILINTTDTFEDCWYPFFKLFKKYWPEYNNKIYLNTEFKEFRYAGLDIISVKNNVNSLVDKITWSECLIRALNFIDFEIVLYMQDDYFLKDFVKNDIVESFVKMIQCNKGIDCIHLTDQGIENHKISDQFPGLYSALPKQRYLISCQAAVWRKSALLKLLRKYENAWQFEEFGSQRAYRFKTKIFGVDKNWIRQNEFELIPYVFTGIIQGRWYEPVVELFNKNDIKIDFERRGFVNSKPSRTLKQKVHYRLSRFPIIMRNIFDRLS